MKILADIDMSAVGVLSPWRRIYLRMKHRIKNIVEAW